LGLVLTLFVAWTAHKREVHDRREAFLQLAENQTATIARTIQNIRDVQLESLAQLCSAQKRITSEDFQQFATYLTNNPSVSAWEWIPVVPSYDKASFELAAHNAGLAGFEIWNKDGQGKRFQSLGVQCTIRSFEWLLWMAMARALGYDLGSEPLRPRGVRRSCAKTGQTTGTNPVVLVQETGTQKRILIFRACIQ